jgi:predicted nucleotide-binding protein
MLEVSAPIAQELLAQCIKQGQALVQRASLVGDFSDYESWKSARKQWIDPTVHALEHMYAAPREARDFTAAVTSAEGKRDWQEQYAADLECVNSAIELLTVLQGELAFDSKSSPSLAQGSPQLAEARPATLEAAPDIGADQPQPATVTLDRDQPEPSSADRAIGAELAARAPLPVAELTPHDQEALAAEPLETTMPAPARTRRVFLAPGRDEQWTQAVAHLLEQAGTHELTILGTNPEDHAALLERSAEGSAGGRYAIVLLTADDLGGPRLESSEEPFFTPRASQQAVFEMGFLAAALTPGCVCVLYEEGIELPCEIEGVSHVRLDIAGTWQPKLLMKLRRAGLDYDLNRLVAV